MSLALTEMSIEELEQLKNDVATEIATRQQKGYVIFSHPCSGASSYHQYTYKHWAKLVKSVDVTKNSGYAFGGEFLEVDREHKIPVGAIVVTVCDNFATLWKANEEDVEEICHCSKKAMSKLIDKANELL